MKFDLADHRRRYDNAIRAGVPVADWDACLVAWEDLVEATAAHQAFVTETVAIFHRLVPPERFQYPGWFLEASETALAVHGVLRTDDMPAYAHSDDFRFLVAYGRARRDPLKYMRDRAAAIRRDIRMRRKALDKILKSAPTPVS